MTKETKVGLVISGSFLLLLGAVIGHRLFRGDHGVNSQQTPGQATTIDPVIDAPAETGEIPAPPKEDDQVVPAAFADNKEIKTGNLPGSVPQQLPKQAAPLNDKSEFAPSIPLPPTAAGSKDGAEDPIAKLLREQKERVESQGSQEKTKSPVTPPKPPISVAQGEKTPPLPMPPGELDPGLPTPPVPAVKADEKDSGPPPPPSTAVPPPPTSNPKKEEDSKPATVVPPPPPVAVPPPPAVPATGPDKTSNVPPPPSEGPKDVSPVPPPPKVTAPPKTQAPNANKDDKNSVLPPAPGNGNVPPPPPPSGSAKKTGNVEPVPPAPKVTPVPPPPEEGSTPVPPAPTKANPTPAGRPANPTPPPPKVGGESNVRTPAISVPMPPRATTTIDPKSGVKITEFVAQQFRVTDEVRTIEDISRRFYYSGKYATALLKFNREKNYLLKGIHENPPLLKPGDVVLVPPTSVLEAMFPSDIPGVSPLPVTPPIKIGGSRPTSPPSQAPAASPANTNPPPVPRPPAIANNPPAPATAPNRKPRLQQPQPLTPSTTPGVYIVQREGEMLFQIARDTLGDGQRWPEIWRLNRQLRPELPVPVGTRLRLPVTAKR